MILIIAPADDHHVVWIEPELRRRGASVLWLDIAELPARVQLSVHEESRARPQSVLRVGDREMDLRTVTAIWLRKPRKPSPDLRITNQILRDYVSQETADTWLGVTAALDC